MKWTVCGQLSRQSRRPVKVAGQATRAAMPMPIKLAVNLHGPFLPWAIPDNMQEERRGRCNDDKLPGYKDMPAMFC